MTVSFSQTAVVTMLMWLSPRSFFVNEALDETGHGFQEALYLAPFRQECSF